MSTSDISPKEHELAKKLVSPDKETREQNLQVIETWFSSRSAPLSEVQLMKLWKGLYYCMWMSDKPFVQLELAERLARLVHTFRRDSGSLLFLQTFYKTIQREWIHIDILRMDKFLSLVRKFLDQGFIFLQNKEWKPLKKYNIILCKGPLQEISSQQGLRSHICSIYVESLMSLLTKPLSSEVFLELLQPFYSLLHSVTDRSSLVSKNIFKALLKNKRKKKFLPHDYPELMLKKLLETASSPQTQNRTFIYKFYERFRMKVNRLKRKKSRGKKRNYNQEDNQSEEEENYSEEEEKQSEVEENQSEEEENQIEESKEENQQKEKVNQHKEEENHFKKENFPQSQLLKKRALKTKLQKHSKRRRS